MKRYTHPFCAHTFIQRKDGRVYGKYWIYFRAVLPLETDSKSWDSIEKAKPEFVQLSTNNLPIISKKKMLRRYLFRTI